MNVPLVFKVTPVTGEQGALGGTLIHIQRFAITPVYNVQLRGVLHVKQVTRVNW